MNLETTRLRGRSRNRWQDEGREGERLVGGKGWKERVYSREEWKKLLRTARNRRILHMPMERTNERMNERMNEFIRASFNDDLTDSTYITSNDCFIVNDEM